MRTRVNNAKYLRSLDAKGEYTVRRAMNHNGKALSLGDRVDVSELPLRKLRQLVRWRKIVPAQAAVAAVAAVAKPKPVAPKAAIKVKAPKPAGIAAPATPPSAAFHSSESAE
jgi:hypothetical protein